MIKDSGRRIQMAGMQRDVTDGKIKYHLVFDGPMFERWAAHLTEGAKKYGERNWQDARTVEERDRFKESAVRHFIQWLRGDTDEDHAAAILFNINGFEYVKAKTTPGQPVSLTPTFSVRVLSPGAHYRGRGVVKDRRICNAFHDLDLPSRRVSSSAPYGRRHDDLINHGRLPACKKEGANEI